MNEPRFRPGDRVKLTAAGIRAGMQGRAKTPYGTVTCTYALSRDYITVRRQDQKTETMFWVGFWELA